LSALDPRERATAAVIATLLVLGGCVSSREVVLTLADRESGARVEAARIEVWHAPVFAKLGAQTVPSVQEGVTDPDGQWRGRVANGSGSLTINASGYGEVLVFFDSSWRWPQSMQLFMTRNRGDDPASRE